MSKFQLLYHTPTHVPYIENVLVRLPGFTELINIPYANVVLNPTNQKFYVHLQVPGLPQMLSIATSYGQTIFTEETIRVLLAGGTTTVNVSNGTSNVVFEPFARYEGSDNDYIGQIIFSKHHAQ